ncbi:MAG: hypothetical protein AB7I79_11430 [Rhizobiaceae bacterium]
MSQWGGLISLFFVFAAFMSSCSPGEHLEASIPGLPSLEYGDE